MIPEPKFPYPDGCPRELIERLHEIACDAATFMGVLAAKEGIVFTKGIEQFLGAAVCVGLTVAAHDTLHRSEKLLSDPAVQDWLRRHPVVGNGRG